MTQCIAVIIHRIVALSRSGLAAAQRICCCKTGRVWRERRSGVRGRGHCSEPRVERAAHHRVDDDVALRRLVVHVRVDPVDAKVVIPQAATASTAVDVDGVVWCWVVLIV